MSAESPVLIVAGRFHKATLMVDGQSINIRVDRLTVEAANRFTNDYARVDDPPSERLLTVRKPGEEMETRRVGRQRTTDEIVLVEALARLRERIGADVDLDAAIAAIPEESTDEAFVIPDAEIRARRLADMTTEQRSEWDRQQGVDEALAVDLLRRAASHLHVPAGQVAYEDEAGEIRPVTEGAELIQLFATHFPMRRAIVNAVMYENAVSTAEKNGLRSRRGSGGSSVARGRAVAGARPEAPAESAASEASATSAAATASSGTASSGLTETSS